MSWRGVQVRMQVKVPGVRCVSGGAERQPHATVDRPQHKVCAAGAALMGAVLAIALPVQVPLAHHQVSCDAGTLAKCRDQGRSTR